jgi:hypothetical protein
MKKLLAGSALAGTALVFGGVGFMYFKGYNITSVETWSMAIQGYLTAPLKMLKAAVSGSDAVLFRGFASVAGGFTVIAGSLVFAVVGSSLNTITLSLKMRSRGRGSRPAKSSARSVLNVLKTKKADPSIDLEAGVSALQEDREPSRIFEVLSALFERLITEAKKRLPKSKPKAVVITRVKQPETAAVIDAAKSTAFYPQLDDWYRRVRDTGGRDFSMIERAKELADIATPKVREDVIEKDAMSGDLKLRMMDAWASKTQVDIPALDIKKPEHIDPEQSVFARAIEDVEASGTIDTQVDDEDDLDLEDDSVFDDLARMQAEMDGQLEEATEPDLDIDLSDQEPDGVGGTSDKVAEDTSDETGDEDSQPDAEDAAFKSIVRATYDLSKEADRVRDGEGEWSPELQDDDYRTEEIMSAFNMLEGQALDVGEARIIQIIEEEEDPEWDWLAEILSDMDAERDRILEISDPLSASTDLPDEEEDEGESGADDLDEYDEPLGDEAASEEASLEAESDGSLDDDEDTDASDLNEDQDEDVATSQVAAGEPDDEAQGDASDDNEAEEDIAERADLAGEALSHDEVKEEPQPATTDPAAGEDEQSASDDAEHAFTKEPEQVAADEEDEDDYIPQNLALPELEEIARSDDLLMRWGIEAKTAGASEAKLVHAVIRKDDKWRRRVVGIVHMAATWRTETNVEKGRLNLIFRYVPAGVWRITSNDGIQMVNDRGDYVGVDDELLEQPEIANSTTVVHFYGPGAPSGLMEKDGRKVCIVSRLLSADEIKGIVIP